MTNNRELKSELRTFVYKGRDVEILYHVYIDPETKEQFTTTELDEINVAQVVHNYNATPSLNAGGILESAQDYADKIVPVMGVKHDRIITTREAIREDIQNAVLYGAGLRSSELEQDFKELKVYLNDLYHQKLTGGKDAGHLWIAFTDKFNAFREKVLAGAAYVKEGEENQDWPPNVWQLGNGAQSHLHGKWCYAYRDSEGLNQHQYPFDTEAEAIEDYRKRFFPSRPSLDIDKVVEQLREQNPHEGNGHYYGWQQCCDKLSELLNKSNGKGKE